MPAVEHDDGEGVEIVPLVVGGNRYAVRLDRIATAFSAADAGDPSPGAVLDLGNHEVLVSAAAEYLGEDAADESAVVVFHARDEQGRVHAWLVDGVGDPATVEGVDVAVGAVSHVLGRVDLEGREAVLIDPVRILAH